MTQSKEKYLEYQKEYREQNKEKLKAYNRTKFDCVCGGKYTRDHKTEHERTKKHQKYINNL